MLRLSLAPIARRLILTAGLIFGAVSLFASCDRRTDTAPANRTVVAEAPIGSGDQALASTDTAPRSQGSIGSSDQAPASTEIDSVDSSARAVMLSIFFHEFGHMLIGELNLPVVGPAEDVVDQFAVLTIGAARDGAPLDQKSLWTQVLGALLDHWSLRTQAKKTTPWWDEHSPDDRRYGQTLCFATVVDADTFVPVARQQGFSDIRLEKCKREYERTATGWERLLEPHSRRASEAATHIVLSVGPSGRPEWKRFEDFYVRGGFFQSILDNLSQILQFPNDVKVIVQACGKTNAFYIPSKHQIMLCHELFQDVMDLRATKARPSADKNAIQQPKIAPSVPQPKDAAADEMEGVWAGTITISNPFPMQCSVTLTHSAGKHYRELVQCGRYLTSQSGTYVFEQGQLVRTVEDWEPKEIYDPTTRTNQKTPKATGGSFLVTFTTPASMTWTDTSLGGVIQFRRQQ